MNWLDRIRRRKSAKKRLHAKQEFKRGYEKGLIAIRSYVSVYGFAEARSMMKFNGYNHPFCLGIIKAIEDEESRGSR